MSDFLNGFIEKLQKAQDTSSDPKTVVAETLRARGITDPQELANVLAQIEVETNYQPRSEDARYSAKRLFELYGAGNKHKNKARFKTVADAQKVVDAGPEAIFDTIYGGRMGNAPNEGHKFRGRGYIQLTGKNNYKYYGEKIGKDLVNDPDLANDPAVAAEIAAVYFLDAKARGTNLADIDATTKAIGAGDKGSFERRKQAAERLFTELGAPGKPKAPAPSPGRFNPDLIGQPEAAPAPQREAPRFQLPELTAPDLPQVDLAPAADAIFNFMRDNANPFSRAQAEVPDLALPSTDQFGITPPAPRKPLRAPSLPSLAMPSIDQFGITPPAPTAVAPPAPTAVAPPAPTAVAPPAPRTVPKPVTPKKPPIPAKVTFERTTPKTAVPQPAPRERRDLGIYNQAGAVSEFIASNPDIYALARETSTANIPQIDPYQTAPGDFPEAVERGWNSGMVQMGSDFQYAKAALEFGSGNADKGRAAMTKASMLEARNAQILGLTPGLDDLVDEPSVDAFITKVGVTLGQVGPSILASVAGAVAGGAVGFASAGPVGAGAGGIGGGVTAAAMQLGARKVTVQAIKKMAKDAAKKKAAGRPLDAAEQKILDGAYQAIKEARGKGFRRGAVAGGFATEYPMMTGASFREFAEAGVDIEDPNYGRASGAIGVPLAAIGVFGEKLILEGALEVATKKLSRQKTNNAFRIVVEDLTKLGVKGAITESITETAQEGALITQRLAVDPDYSMDEASLRLAEAAFAGFIAGGAVGGASGGFAGAGRSMNYEDPLTAEQFRGFRDDLGGLVNDTPLGPPPGLPPTTPGFVLRNNTYTEEDKAIATRTLEVGQRFTDSLEAGAFTEAAAEIAEMKAQMSTMVGRATLPYRRLANFVKQAEVSLRAAQRRANPTENLMGRAREMLDKTRSVQVEAAMDAEATGAQTNGPAQEPVADFQAQYEYIRTVEESPKKSMWVPANSVYQPNFAGRTDLTPFTLYKDAGLYAAYVPGEGTIISRDEAAVARVIVAARTNGNVEAALADALGYSNVKTEDADRVVRVVDGEGRVVSEEATDALNEQDAVTRAQAIADAGFGYTVDVKPVEDALIDRRDRFEGEDDATDAEFTEVDDNGEPIVRNMTQEEGPADGTVSFPLPARRALNNLRGQFKDAKNLTPEQWIKALTAAGATKADIDLVIKPLLDELSEGGTKRVTKQELEDGLRLVEPRGRVQMQDASFAAAEKESIYNSYVPSPVFQAQVFGADLSKADSGVNRMLSFGDKKNQVEYQQYQVVDDSSSYSEHNWNTPGVLAHYRYLLYGDAVLVAEIQSSAMQALGTQALVPSDVQVASLQQALEAANREHDAFEAQYTKVFETLGIIRGDVHAFSAYPEVSELRAALRERANRTPGAKEFLKARGAVQDVAAEFARALYNADQRALTAAAKALTRNENIFDDSTQDIVNSIINDHSDSVRYYLFGRDSDAFFAKMQALAAHPALPAADASRLATALSSLETARQTLIATEETLVGNLGLGDLKNEVALRRKQSELDEALRSAHQKLSDAKMTAPPAKATSLTLWSTWERNGLFHAMNLALDEGKDRVVLTNGAALHPDVRHPKTWEDRRVGYNQGLVKFYDEDLPNIAKKVAAAIGAKVEFTSTPPAKERVPNADGFMEERTPKNTPPSPGYYTIVLTPEAKAALMERRAQFEDGGQTYTRFMRNEDVNNFKSGPQFDAAVAVGEDVGIPIRTGKGADSYAPADPAQRKIPQDIFDARFNAALAKIDEDAQQTFLDNVDNMSDSALDGLERAIEKYPDDFIYMTVEQDDVGQDRVFIKRTPRTFGRGDIEQRRAELLPQLEALARETPYDKEGKRPRPIGTGGVTPITVIAPDGKVSRPNMWRLAVIGGKLNGIESISDVFPLGDKPSPVQVASMSIQRAVTELLELGYSFEISYLDGTLDGKRASRPLQLNRRDYAPLPGWQNFPPLKDQVLVRRRSASGQITQFTYDQIINAGQPQVEQKDSSAIRIERYKEGPRKRSEARLARKWMQMRNAALRAYPKMTPAEQASVTARFGDMSNKTDLKTWPDQIDLANAYMDERLTQQDEAFFQRLRDQDLAFDPNDIDSVKDADRELAFQNAQAYLKDNPDDQQQYEDRSESDLDDTPDDIISEFIDAATDADINAALAMDLPTSVREALIDYPELITVEQIRVLKSAQRDGVLQYMYARPQRSQPRSDGSRVITGVDIIQGRIPKAQRTTEFNNSLRGLIAALDGLQPAGALMAFRDFISPEQLARWWKIIENGAVLNKLRVEKGLGGIVRMARPVRSPGEETAPADLFRTVIEFQKDPTMKEQDAATKDRVVTDKPNDPHRRMTKLANRLETAKKDLKNHKPGTEAHTQLRAEIRQMQADLTRLKQAMFGDEGRKLQSAGATNTQPRAQGKTERATVETRSPVPGMVSRAIGVAAGVVKPGKPTDVFTASDLQERLQEHVDAGHIPAALVPIIRQQLAQMATDRKTLGALAARGRYIVILNDLETAGPVDEAVLAAAVGHEFGHIVFLDEFGDIEEGKLPHVPRLIAAYNDYANAQKSKGERVLPFEEWFSDQVAAYVYREAAGLDQKRSKGSKFERRVDYDRSNDDFFATVAKKLDLLFKRVNAILRGRLDQSQQFVDWFEELIFVRKQNGPNNHNVLSGIAIRNMAAAANGALTPVPGGPQAQSTGPGSLTAQMIATINNMLKQFVADPGRVLKRTFYASEDYLRALGAEDIAKFFYGRSQSREEIGFHRAKEFEQNRWFSVLSDAIGIDRDNMTDAEIDQVLFEAEDNTIPTAQLSPKAKAVRQVFDDMYEKYISYYVRDSKGRLVKQKWFDVKKGQNYSPRQINTAAIAKNPDAFAAWLVNNGYMSVSEARNLAYELATYQDQVDPNQGNDPMGTPIMPHGKQRTLAFIPTKELRNARGPGADPTYGWIIPPQLAMTRYMHFVTRKVEYERRGGKDMMKSLVMSLPEEKRDDAINMIEANLGKLGTDIQQRPAARFVNSVSQTATALTTLTFAVLSSLPDLAGVLIRSKDTSNFMDAFRQMRATLTDTENRDLARAVGVVTNQALDSVFMAPGEMDFTAPWAKKIMEKFFQFNGTEAYTRFVRTFAAGMGREFLVNTAFDPQFGPRQERWLAELGLTRQDVIDWQQSPHFNQGDIERGVTLRGGAPGSLEHRIANAIARFSDEAIIRPNSAMKPGWASNPYFTIVWQLKSYFYAYGKVVMGGMFREFSTRVEEGDTRGAYAQLLLAAGAILPLTMIGLEARELIKYFARLTFPWIGNADMALQTDRMDLGEYSFEIIDRSGMLGPWTLAISTLEGIERDGLIGPVTGNVPMVDMADEVIFEGDWSRAVPVVNNL